MLIAFERPVTVFGRLIAAWTSRGCAIKVIHVEVELEPGRWWGSRAGSGVAFFHDAHPADRWIVLQVQLPDGWQAKAANFMSQETGCGYDFCGVLRFIIPFIRPHKRRWWCSEIVCSILQSCNVVEGLHPSTISPQLLYDILLSV